MGSDELRSVFFINHSDSLWELASQQGDRRPVAFQSSCVCWLTEGGPAEGMGLSFTRTTHCTLSHMTLEQM